MKNIYALFIAALLIAGCSDPVKIDLTSYTRQIKPLTAIEENVINRWNSVSGKSFVNDSYMYQALDEYIIDNCSKVVDGLKNIKLQTNEVKSLNNIYISAAEKQLSGYQLMKTSLEKHDPKMMNDAYKLLTDGRAIENDWASKLEQMLKQH